ncbi:MAG: ATP synthase F1 subunit gamma [Deltaproteobacteria bacterium]|nr:ATP synthase F1 subunit gamma [Deltaproteobacteria bacterium]|tara:strand:- start:1679 stop:2560 length:882 start_codon:yes stop_codon:yes gene_type:complete
MANLKAIRTRIGSVKSTQQITKAMKMVAAAKLRRAQDALFQGRPYARGIADMVKRLASITDSDTHPLLQERTGTKTLVLVITSDRGLCGAFNSNIQRAAEGYIKENIGECESIKLAFIGRKGRDYFRLRSQRLGTPIAHYFEEVFTNLHADTVREISDTIIDEFVEGEYDRVMLLFNEFKSTISQKVVLEQFLPITAPELDGDEENEGNSEYIFEPSQDKLFELLLPLYVSEHLQRALRESFASEMGARMAAMDAATNNARDLIEQLTLLFNRARQAAITTEIIEIVSGAEAL